MIREQVWPPTYRNCLILLYRVTTKAKGVIRNGPFPIADRTSEDC